MMARLRALLLLGTWGFGLAVFGPVCLPLTVLTGREEWITYPATFFVNLGLRLGGVRVTISGRERLDPDATYVFASNHQSVLDAPILWVSIGSPRKRIGYLLKKELEKVPVLYQGVKLIGMVPVDRGDRERAVVSASEAAERLRAGRSFAVFVEGTRTRDGKLRPFKKGAFHMAVQAGVPVVPVSIEGAFEAMPPNKIVLNPVPLHLTLHEPIPTEGMTEDDVSRLLARTREQIATRVPS